MESRTLPQRYLVIFLQLLSLISNCLTDLTTFPFGAVVRYEATPFVLTCQSSRDPLSRRQPLTTDLTFLFLPFRQKVPRKMVPDLSTSIRRKDATTLEMELKSLSKSDEGTYACVKHWGSQTRLGDQVTLDLYVSTANQTKCQQNHFRCTTGECLLMQFRCDHLDNCPDGSDEDECGELCFDKFRCRNGRCLDQIVRCDRMYTNNCGDWSDEFGCYDTEDSKSDKTKIRKSQHQLEMEAYRMTLFVAIGCLSSVIGCLVIIFCVCNHIRNNELRQARKVSNPREEGFQQKRKRDEVSERIKKDAFERQKGRRWMRADELNTLSEVTSPFVQPGSVPPDITVIETHPPPRPQGEPPPPYSPA